MGRVSRHPRHTLIGSPSRIAFCSDLEELDYVGLGVSLACVDSSRVWPCELLQIAATNNVDDTTLSIVDRTPRSSVLPWVAGRAECTVEYTRKFFFFRRRPRPRSEWYSQSESSTLECHALPHLSCSGPRLLQHIQEAQYRQ